MRISFRWIISLVVVTAAVALAFAFFEVRSGQRALRNELENRAASLGGYMQDQVEEILTPSRRPDLEDLLNRVQTRDDLYGIAIYDDQGDMMASTAGVANLFVRMGWARVEGSWLFEPQRAVTAVGVHCAFGIRRDSVLPSRGSRQLRHSLRRRAFKVRHFGQTTYIQRAKS